MKHCNTCPAWDICESRQHCCKSQFNKRDKPDWWNIDIHSLTDDERNHYATFLLANEFPQWSNQ